MNDGIKVMLGALGGAALTLVFVAIFTGGGTMSGPTAMGMGQMMNGGMDSMRDGMPGGGMMGGGAMGAMLLFGVVTIGFWALVLVAVVALAVWGVRKLSTTRGRW